METTINKKKSAKVNYFWNLLYQIVIIIAPIVTTPYVSRVLTEEGIGQYSFSYSIMYYFFLFASLGFAYYAQREIAKKSDDKKAQSLIFWEINIVRSVSTIIGLLGLFAIVWSNSLKDYNILLMIFGLQVLSVMFDPSFLFQGNQDFKAISIKNSLIKIVLVALIFIFVKSQSDLWIYTLLNAGGMLLSAIIMLPAIKKYLIKVSLKELKIKKHIAPAFRLFIPTLAISIYVMLDKTMIGLMIPGQTIDPVTGAIKKISDIENGYYEQADKIIKLAMTIITSLGIVMLPKNAEFIEKKDFEGLRKNIYKSIRFTLMLAFPMMLGIICIATNFSPWFFGEGYEKVPYLLMILSPVFLMIGVSGVLGVQYMVAAGNDIKFMISVLIGAVINVVLNIILINNLHSYGVAIASVVAETVVMVTQIIMLRKVFNFKDMFKQCYKYLIAAVVMFGVIYPLGYFVFNSSIINTIILVFIGIIVYGGIVMLLKDSYVMETLSSFKRLLKRNKN